MEEIRTDNTETLINALERIAELEKENAELKGQVEMSYEVYNNNLDYSHHIEEQLTKAKELLNEFMRISKASDEDFEHDYSELIVETETFLKEVSE